MSAANIERIVVVTKKTPLAELIERLNSKDQARFYLEQNQVSFTEYELADKVYEQAVAYLKQHLPRKLKQQFIDRSFLPTYQFSEHDLVITLGPDGLVINTAKYLTTQPILALNPDPQRVDGILIPFTLTQLLPTLERTLRGEATIKPVSMVKAALNDGQTLYGVNDLFIGPRTHTSARYLLSFAGQSEVQSSSGIIVSTGAGSTGWLSSITLGAWHISHYFAENGSGAAHYGKKRSSQPPMTDQTTLDWSSNKLWFTVREPFVSKTTQATIVFGQIQPGQELVITSQMPDNGVIFSDGIENDYLTFHAGLIARVGLADRRAHLITK